MKKLAPLNINYHLLLKVVVVVVSLKEALAAVRDGDLSHHRTRPKRGPMKGDAVAEDLGEDPPGLQPPVKRLMTRPHPPRHRPTLGRALVRVRGAHDLVGMPRVPLVGLDPLAGLELLF